MLPIKPQPAPPEAPPGLSQRSLDLWAHFAPPGEKEAGRRALLAEALRALDRADQARAMVDTDGLVSGGGGKIARAHPALRIERESRAAFAKLLQQLGLDQDPALPWET